MRIQIATPRHQGNPDDRLIPLINIVFLMLIFFMIAGHVTSQRLPGDVQLPNSTQVNPAQQGLHVLAVNTRGELTLDQEPVTEDALAQKLQELMQDDPELTLQLCLDHALDAATLTPLLKQLRTLGLHKVMLISSQVGAP
jgi:biopolymer transport protein ExbD